MRLLSLNVALFEANNKQLFDFLKKIEPDIICLQEISEEVDPNVKEEYLSKDYIDKATKGLRFSFFGPTWIIRDFHRKNFHKKENFDFEFGGFIRSGNYMKSKFKMVYASNVFMQYRRIKFTDWSDWPQKQPKAVQVVDLEMPNLKTLRILNYHGIWTKEKIGNEETLKACRKILALAKEASYPVIIAGDFNLFPDTESMRVFKNDFISLVDEYKISTTRLQSNELSGLERNVVDYILMGKGIRVNSFQVLKEEVSDHLPLILDFELQ